MDWIKSFLTFHWQRKLVAFLSALIIWIFVNQSITDIKTIPNVPIRIINLPEDKTIPGMQPNGIIGKRIPLTIQGTKNIIHLLEPGDIEVLLDASTIHQNDWVVKVNKKNLVSLNPSIDLSRHISEVSHPEFVLKFSQLMTAKIPVNVLKPKGEAPLGYKYLDIWPQKLMQTVTGPQEQVRELINKGVDLVIDMNLISKADLEKLKPSRENYHDDEVSFFIPAHWKKIALPFKGGILEDLNDPEAQDLHIDFLKREYFPLPPDIAMRVFYPLETLDKLNPQVAPLLPEGKIGIKSGVPFLSTPLFIRDVSLLFLEVIQNNIEIVIVASDSLHANELHWAAQVVDPHLLEDVYVNSLIAQNSGGSLKIGEPRHTKKRESHLRERFRNYVQKLTLYTAPEKKLQFDIRLTKEGISTVPTSI
jgi:hypothetical protein